MGMRLGFLGAAILALTACSPSKDGTADNGPCDAPSGSYSFRVERRDGDCGELPEQVVSISPPNPLQFSPDVCTGRASYADDDRCALDYDLSCPTSDGLVTIRFNGHLNWNTAATEASGVLQVTFSGGTQCSGTYDASYTKL